MDTDDDRADLHNERGQHLVAGHRVGESEVHAGVARRSGLLLAAGAGYKVDRGMEWFAVQKDEARSGVSVLDPAASPRLVW